MNRQIRIYAIIPVRGGLQSWGDTHRELLVPLASPDVEITLADLPEAPVEAISDSYTSELVALQHVQAAIDAERAGYDAVAITLHNWQLVCLLVTVLPSSILHTLGVGRTG